jgi:hypothetical protein
MRPDRKIRSTNEKRMRMNPFADYVFAIGSGFSIPIANDEKFDLRRIISIFYHF